MALSYDERLPDFADGLESIGIANTDKDQQLMHDLRVKK